MLQIIGLLAISWLVLWLFDKSNLSVLGLAPTGKKARLVVLLFFVTAICCATTFLLRMYLAKEQYALNPDLTWRSFFAGVWETQRGVLTEELICRGALLYILIKKLGSKWAILISSVLFGLLHWLNNGVFGNPGQMALVFLFTFAFGLVFAYAYAKTFSILFPIAIHSGWNLTQNFIFPERIEGTHVFVMTVPPPIVTVSYFAFLFLLLFPKISAIGMNYFILRRQKQIEQP